MLHLVFIAALSADATPQPSPTPRTIVHERVTPICTVLRENIGHAIQAVLANDQAIGASKPVLVKMAHDFVSSSNFEAIGLGDLHSSAAIDHDSPKMQLDLSRMEQVVGALTHNLKLIEDQLNDPARFPAVAKTDSDRKALEIKAQLEAVAKQQKQTLNVLEGLIDTRNMETIAGRGDPMEKLFGADDTGNPSSANAKDIGSNAVFNAGPLTQTPEQKYDPALTQDDFSTLTNSLFGRFYRVVYLEQGAIQSLESPLAKNVVETTSTCSGR